MKFGITITILSFVFFLFSHVQAFSYCSEPSFYGSAPDAPSTYSKPSVPYCMSGYSYSGDHDCEDYEIDAYFDEVNYYIDKLNDYVDEAREFHSNMTRFVNDAIEYAQCEARDVRTQHE